MRAHRCYSWRAGRGGAPFLLCTGEACSATLASRFPLPCSPHSLNPLDCRLLSFILAFDTTKKNLARTSLFLLALALSACASLLEAPLSPPPLPALLAGPYFRSCILGKHLRCGLAATFSCFACPHLSISYHYPHIPHRTLHSWYIHLLVKRTHTEQLAPPHFRCGFSPLPFSNRTPARA